MGYNMSFNLLLSAQKKIWKKKKRLHMALFATYFYKNFCGEEERERFSCLGLSH